jgi:hypothetical protein
MREYCELRTRPRTTETEAKCAANAEKCGQVFASSQVTGIAETAADTALARKAWWLFITVIAVIIITKCKKGPVFGAILAKNDASKFSHYADARIFLAADAEWMKNPVGLANQYVQGMGERNDLKSVQN